jgi:hypothetical protein
MKNTTHILLLLAVALLVALPGRSTTLLAQDKPAKPATEKPATEKPDDKKGDDKKDDDKKTSNKKKDDDKKKGNGKKKKKRTPVSVTNHLTRLAKIKLTDDQKNKLEPISKDYVGRYTRARQKFEAAVDETTRKARVEAEKKFRAKGHRGDKLRQSIDNAVELTRVQKAAIDIFRKQKQELDSGLRKVLWAALNEKERKIVGLPEKLEE